MVPIASLRTPNAVQRHVERDASARPLEGLGTRIVGHKRSMQRLDYARLGLGTQLAPKKTVYLDILRATFGDPAFAQQAFLGEAEPCKERS